MVDSHCHLLPGIDDGPRDLGASLELARAAAAQGVTTIAATPHVRPDHPAVVPGELAERCDELRAELSQAAIALDVVVGGELDLLWALEASREELRLVSFGQRGKDLLVETPYGALPTSFEDLLFRLALQGFRVLLAHPERNPSFQGGALARRLVRDGLAHGLAHAIASDAHGPGSFGRASLAAGAAAAAELVGQARARWLVGDAPRALIDGRPLPPQPPAEASRRGLLKRLRPRS